METIEVNGEVIRCSILDVVEFHCDVLIGGQVVAHSELLSSPIYRWTLQRIKYNSQKDLTIIHLEDTAW